ncbi:MAG: LutC/YkgG family protein [bacterium]
MKARDYVLHKTRAALGRRVGQPPAPAPEPRLRVPSVSMEERIERFTCALETLAGTVHLADSPAEARERIRELLAGRTAVASNSPLLAACGVTDLEGVRAGITSREELRAVCAMAGVGITGADYALADTGSLVLMSSADEARMISLLPPAHIALVPLERMLTGLDELLSVVPDPAEVTSSMLLITGPSRTADIEQILVRGVHGPGEIHVVLLRNTPDKEEA